MSAKKNTRAPKPESDDITLAELEESEEGGSDLEAGKAVAKANKEELDSTLTTDDGRDIEALREERAEIIQELQEKAVAKDQRLVEEANEAGLHEAKLDDIGAAEQQKAARDNDVALQTRLGELSGPPVVAPQIEDSPASIKVVSRREGEKFEKGTDYAEVSEARFVGYNLHIIGEDFLSPGEVIIDIAQENGQNHQRYSAWTDDGNLDTVLPGIVGVGEYLVHCEQVVTQVGEGRDDGLQQIDVTNEVQLSLY